MTVLLIEAGAVRLTRLVVVIAIVVAIVTFGCPMSITHLLN